MVLLLSKRVWAVTPQPLGRLRRGKARIHIHTEPAGNIGWLGGVSSILGRHRPNAHVICGRHHDFSLSDAPAANGSAAAPGGACASRVFLIS